MPTPKTQQHTLSVLVRDEPGVLTRIAGMFSRRGYNLKSLSVGASEKPNLSRMTIVAIADDEEIDQMRKQLDKLITNLYKQNIDKEQLIELNPPPKIPRETAHM